MSRSVFCLALLGVAWAAGGSAGADIQQEPPKQADVEKFRTTYEAAFKDDPTPPTMEQLKQSEILAQYLVFRLTRRREYHDTPGAMAKLYTDCDHWIDLALSPKKVKNVPLGQAFAKKMLEALDKVLAPPDQLNITRVNAARVLARLAGASQMPETADLLAKVISDPKEVDGARYWAFRGLHDLYQGNPKPPDGERRDKAVEALVQFIERPNKATKETPQEEVDGLCVVRREAVRALGAVRDPGVANKKNAEAAWALLRVLSRDKALSPPPRLDEQVEAAIGLCNLRPDAKGDYQPGYAVAQVGQFVIDFFNGKRADETKREPRKIQAARMEEALRGMETALAADPVVKAVAPAAVALLRGIQQDKGTTSDNELRDALGKVTLPPSLYKSNPKAVAAPREGQ